MSSLNHYLFLIFILFFTLIKSENWWGEITGYDITDHSYGYAGDSLTPIIDFYLCGNRDYRVHYLDDPPDVWSKNFTNCDPVGVGRIIDGICIYTKKSYKGKLLSELQWLPVVKECNISDIDQYVGILGTSLACLAINGEDKYRVGYINNNEAIISSNPKNLSDRIVKNFFGNKTKNLAEYDKEYEIDLSLDENNKNKIKNFKAYIQLLENKDINLNGDEIKYSFCEKNKIYSPWDGQKINKLMIKKIKDIINFDFNEKINIFKNEMLKEIIKGTLTIHSYFEEYKIQMDIASKIKDDFSGFRGGIRLNLLLNNSEKLIELIQKLLKVFEGYLYINEGSEEYNKINNFTDIKQLSEINKIISPYDLMLTQIIFLYLINN